MNKVDSHIEVKRKSGFSRIDLKQWVEEIHLKDDTSVEMLVRMTGGKTVRPFEVLKAIFNLTEDENGTFSVLKTEVNFRIEPSVPAKT